MNYLSNNCAALPSHLHGIPRESEQFLVPDAQRIVEPIQTQVGGNAPCGLTLTRDEGVPHVGERKNAATGLGPHRSENSADF